MIKADLYYKENLQKIKNFGCLDENPRPKYSDGTPAHTRFITQIFEEYDLNNNEFPITTLRNTAIKTGIKEIFWIYQKQSNSLEEARNIGIDWWDEWNIGDDTIGQRYGATVKRYDVVNNILNALLNDPFGRSHIINLFQYKDLKETKGLNPCAFESLFSFRKINSEYFLDLTLVQRSNDYIMAGYINKIQYVSLLQMFVGHLNYYNFKCKIGKFCHLVQNLHIYDRHFEAANEILIKEPLNEQPLLILKENKDFYNYTIDDFVIKNINNITKINSKLEIAI